MIGEGKLSFPPLLLIYFLKIVLPAEQRESLNRFLKTNNEFVCRLTCGLALASRSSLKQWGQLWPNFGRQLHLAGCRALSQKLFSGQLPNALSVTVVKYEESCLGSLPRTYRPNCRLSWLQSFYSMRPNTSCFNLLPEFSVSQRFTESFPLPDEKQRLLPGYDGSHSLFQHRTSF